MWAVPLASSSARRSIPRSTIERWSSGSWTGRSASTSCSLLTAMAAIVARSPRVCTTRVVQFRHGDQRRLHRHGVGDHRCLRRPHPSPDLPLRPRPRGRRRRHGGGGRERGRRPSQRGAAPPRQARRRRLPRGPLRPRRRRRSGSPVEALPRRRRRDHRVPGALRRSRALAARPRARAALAEGCRTDGRTGRRRVRAGDGGRASPARRSMPATVRCARRCRPSPTP